MPATIATLPQRSQPSTRAGYATSASESAYPDLWRKLLRAWSPLLQREPVRNETYDAYEYNSGGDTWDSVPNEVFADGGWWRFDGTTSSYAILVDVQDGAIYGESDFTVVTKVRTRDLAIAQVIWMACDFSETNVNRALSFYQVGDLWRAWERNTLLRPVDSTTSAVANEWQTVAAEWTYDGTFNDTRSIYVDGIFEATSVSTSAATAAFDRVSVGAAADASESNWFDGDIAIVLEYGRKLSSAEHLLLHRDPYAPFRRRVPIIGTFTAAAPSGAHMCIQSHQYLFNGPYKPYREYHAVTAGAPPVTFEPAWTIGSNAVIG